MKKDESYDIEKSIAIIITSAAAAVVSFLGIEFFFEGSLIKIFLLWLIVVYAAAGVSHLVSMITFLFAGKDLTDIFLALCPVLLIIPVIISAELEKKHFFGEMGAGIIIGIFIPPLIAAALFWGIFAIVRMRKKYREAVEQLPG